MKVKVFDFEERVWALDGIRIIIRIPSNKKVPQYDYINKAMRSMTAAHFIETRIKPYLSESMEVSIVDGRGEITRGKTQLRKVRGSYVQPDD